MEKLNGWLTLFANLGIVVGLVLVAVQLDQAALFADADQSNAEFSFTFGAQEAALADSLPEAWARARVNATDLTEIEISLVDTYLTRVAFMQMLEHIQASRGIGVVEADSEAFGFVHYFLGNETSLRWWRSQREIFATVIPEFVEAVDGRIAEAGPTLRNLHKRQVRELGT